MQTRRQALANFLFGASGVGLRSLATGLPASFLLRPLAARAEEATVCADKTRAQYLILSTSGAGDPFNANAPGTYDVPKAAHAADPSMAKTPLKLGGFATSAAQVYSTLPQWVLDRSTFVHHATLTNSHPNHPKVLRLMGETERSEMAPSLFARALAPCLGTVQGEPVSAGAGKVFTYAGKNLPDLKPRSIKDLLVADASALGKLQTLRDQSVDEIAALLKARGGQAQLKHMDDLVLSRTQARSLSDELLNLLSTIKSDGPEGQITAAVALIKMNVAPVVYVRFPFGGDNHTDAGLMVNEVPQHIASLASIAQLMQALKDHGLEDRVTFGVNNVFGRTLAKKGTTGRDHWGTHHVTMLIGKHVNPGVVGGLVPNAKMDDYVAGAFNATTGRLDPAGDVSPDDSLAAMGKTMGAVLGVDNAFLDKHIKTGKVIAAAVKPA